MARHQAERLDVHDEVVRRPLRPASRPSPRPAGGNTSSRPRRCRSAARSRRAARPRQRPADTSASRAPRRPRSRCRCGSPPRSQHTRRGPFRAPPRYAIRPRAGLVIRAAHRGERRGRRAHAGHARRTRRACAAGRRDVALGDGHPRLERRAAPCRSSSTSTLYAPARVRAAREARLAVEQDADLRAGDADAGLRHACRRTARCAASCSSPARRS